MKFTLCANKSKYYHNKKKPLAACSPCILSCDCRETRLFGSVLELFFFSCVERDVNEASVARPLVTEYYVAALKRKV